MYVRHDSGIIATLEIWSFFYMSEVIDYREPVLQPTQWLCCAVIVYLLQFAKDICESCVALCCGNLISNLVLLICIMNKVIQHKSVYGKSASFSSSHVFCVEATLCIMFLFNLSPSQIYDNSCRGERSNLQVRFDGDRTGWVHLLSCKPLLPSVCFQERGIRAGQLHCKFCRYNF